MNYTIIADSSCDLYDGMLDSPRINFITVPINITVDVANYHDGVGLDTKLLLRAAKTSKTAVKTACPSPEIFLEQMQGRDNIIILTLSSKLSGTYSSACHAAEAFLKENPTKNVFVLDSLLTSAGMAVMLIKLKEMIDGNTYSGFKDLTDAFAAYAKTIKIRFVLSDYSGLVKSGRMPKVAFIIASALLIKPICGDNGAGEIKLYYKCLGVKKSLKTLYALAAEKLSADINAPIVITHCNNNEDATYLHGLISEKFAKADVKIYPMRGTASVYAGAGGVAIAF